MVCFLFYFLLRDNEHTLQLTNRKWVKSSRRIHGLISQGNIPKKSSYEGFRTDSSANCRLRAGLSTLVRPFYMLLSDVVVRSITHRSRLNVLSRSIPLASLRVSLIVANRCWTTGIHSRVPSSAGGRKEKPGPSLSSSDTLLWCLRTYLLTIQLNADEDYVTHVNAWPWPSSPQED